MAKRPQRTPEQQEYRDKLAHDLRNLRNRYWDKWKELAQTLLDDQHKSDEYIKSLGNRKVDKQVALDLIEKGDIYTVVNNLDKFKDLDKEVAIKLVECWHWRAVVEKSEKFAWLFLNEEIAEKLIQTKDMFSKDSQWKYVAYYLEKFEWLDYKKIAMEIIEHGAWYSVVENLDKFWVDHSEIVNKLIDSGQWVDVLRNWNKFKWINRDDVVQKMFDRWDWWCIVSNRSRIDPNSEYYTKEKEERLRKFYDWLVFDQNLAEKLINIPSKEWRTGAVLVDCLQYFEWLDYKKIALELIDKWYGIKVASSIWKFKNLDKEVDKKLLNEGNTYSHRRIDSKSFKEIFWYIRW